MFEQITLIVDIDGTICPIKNEKEKYEDLVPYSDIVENLRDYHNAGAKIVLFTSRNMKTYQGNLGMINAHTAKVMLAWLEHWEIPYDEIIYGKPWPGPNGFYIDDRSIRPREFLKYSLEQLNVICGKDKLLREDL